MAVTVKEVASHARVSIGTVSRVLNADPTVSDDCKIRVRQAVEALNYVPLRKRGRHKASGRLTGHNIGMVMLGMDRSLSRLPVVAEAIHGAEAALARAGATCLLLDVPVVGELPPSLLQMPLHGLILKGAQQGDLAASLHPELLRRMETLPTVWILGRPLGTPGDRVQASSQQVGQLAALHLVSRGHRQLAFLNPKPDHLLLAERHASFLWQARQLGATVTEFLGESQSWSLPLQSVQDLEPVQRLVDRMLKSKRKPTAVFVPCDSMAALVYRALSQRSIRPGKDIGIIGCNNETPLLTGLFPALTTIEVHAAEMGKRAVDQLAWRLEHGLASPATEINLQPDLVEGASV